mmetsp:Transcript_24120/g.39033  ORF Transcript_24120/g.39033 Transcript_24120/m.39033 type:complete len:271 (-) Transcript_24120:778-1590(-)
MSMHCCLSKVIGDVAPILRAWPRFVEKSSTTIVSFPCANDSGNEHSKPAGVSTACSQYLGPELKSLNANVQFRFSKSFTDSPETSITGRSPIHGFMLPLTDIVKSPKINDVREPTIASRDLGLSTWKTLSLSPVIKDTSCFCLVTETFLCLIVTPKIDVLFSFETLLAASIASVLSSSKPSVRYNIDVVRGVAPVLVVFFSVSLIQVSVVLKGPRAHVPLAGCWLKTFSKPARIASTLPLGSKITFSSLPVFLGQRNIIMPTRMPSCGGA